MEDIDKQIIYGDIVSKPNCYKIITINGHGSLAKQPKLKEYEKTFYLQCNKYRDKNITGLFEAYIDCYLPSNRQDLDNAMKVFLDSLQSCNAIKNDRNCVKIVAQKFIDKKNPRIEFILKEIK